jgi:hypothetical protein
LIISILTKPQILGKTLWILSRSSLQQSQAILLRAPTRSLLLQNQIPLMVVPPLAARSLVVVVLKSRSSSS